MNFDRKKNPARFAGFFAFACLFLSSCAVSKPEWTSKRPVDRTWYYGLGSSAVLGNPEQERGAARENALNDIASQISIQVDSKLLRTVTEKNSVLSESFRSEVKTRVKQELDDVQVADSWEGGGHYWVMLKLNRQKFLEKRNRKKRAAVQRAKAQIEAAKKLIKAGRPAGALATLFRGLKFLENHLAESPKAVVDGRNVFLADEIVRRMDVLLSDIDLKLLEELPLWKRGSGLAKDLLFRISFSGEGASEFPLVVDNPDSDAQVLCRTRSSINGRASCRPRSSGVSPRRLRISVDRDALLNLKKSASILRAFADQLAWSSREFPLESRSVKVWLDIREKTLKSGNKVLEPGLKALASRLGLVFSKRQDAEVILTVRLESAVAPKVHGFFPVYVDIDLSAKLVKSGTEFWNASLSQLKGVHTRQLKAENKAVQSALDALGEKLLPELLNSIPD